MFSNYDIGDTVILSGTVERIEQIPTGEIVYTLKEYDRPIRESMIIGKVEPNWHLVKCDN